MRHGLAAIAAAFMIIALPMTAFSQPVSAPATVFVMAGAAMPMGDLDDAVKAGFTVGGGVQFGISTLPVGLRAELAYTRFGEKNASGEIFGEPFAASSKGSNLSVLLNAILAPRVPATQIQPYALAGVGFYNSTVDQAGTFGADIDFAIDDSKGSFGFNGGAGVRFQFVGFSSFVEARYHHILEGRAELNENEETEWKSAAYLPITFGISFGGR
jgi:opacity protein-like surface antigen